MKNYFIAFSLAFALLLVGADSVYGASAVGIFPAERAIPPYAKWGQIAMSRVKEKYPQADIVDYQHLGRQTGATTSTEKFKLWLKQGSREFAVFVDITFENKTEKIITIKYRESTR